MATVRADTLKIAQKLTKEVEKRIRADFVAEPKGRKTLTKEFDDSLREKAIEMAYVVSPIADAAMRQEYVGMLNDVANRLAKGFDNPQEHNNSFLTRTFPLLSPSKPSRFNQLSESYWYRKRKHKPGTEHLFWKYTGALSKSMRSFATKQASAAGLMRSSIPQNPFRGSANTFKLSGKGSTYQAIKLIGQDYKSRRMRYRFTLAVSLPPIEASEFRDILFRQQFILHEQDLPYTQADEPAATFRHMAYNEPLRPWVQRMVKLRGKHTERAILNRIKTILG